MTTETLLNSLQRLIETINSRDVAEFYSPDQVEQLVNLLKQTIIDLIAAIKLGGI